MTEWVNQENDLFIINISSPKYPPAVAAAASSQNTMPWRNRFKENLLNLATKKEYV